MMTIPTNPSKSERATYVANILRTYGEASPSQVEKGRQWYAVAHDIAVTIAGDARTGAGVIAVLSARQSWERNVKFATACFATGEPVGHTRANLEKARRIMEGENPETILPMELKTGNFYRCILDPNDSEAVVIDRHAHDLAVGERYSDRDNRGLSNVNRYNALADAYREAARTLGVSPSTVQATTWVVWTERYAR